ncbi:cell division protein FtsQ/DivIB [Peptoniphilus sp.]|uniref:cell division protein FtsQ/DivIB n=1 Tax=Peptoniphilus sp. TaxID=1971214 RepID=UPI002A8249D9|nr:FtsQ-type POTRA domain-containing protein [Peptoniphilus sp.]MDY3902288.1 FtsQ-type POTRA domain-containing protein [Peptoniphilus sp.]
MKKMKKKKRKLNKKRKYFRIFTRFFLFFFFVFLLIFALKNSNLFNIKNVTIEGNKNVTAATIKKVSELKQGNKYFVISKKKRQERIKSIPYIRDAKISYSITGKVKVKVAERTPYYQMETNEYLLIDEDFRILENSKKKADNLINLSGFNLEDQKPGSYILNNKEDEEKKDLLLEIKKEEYSLNGNIKEIELMDSIATFTTVSGIKIEFGSYNNTSYKLKMLSLILDDIKKTNKNAVIIQMEKGESPILITNDENNGDNKNNNEAEKENSKENNEKSYKEIEKN